MSVNGIFDPDASAEGVPRPFVFRTPPYGTGEFHWRRMMIALNEAGYDGVLSIEHEDMEISQREGVQKAAAFLRSLLYEDPADRCRWKAPIREYQREFLPTKEEGGLR